LFVPPVHWRHLDDEVDRRARARVGSVLDDKWTLERLLGVGGMAAVYAACHRNGARAAVKVLHPDLARHSEVRERFQREGYAANRVGHAGAVTVLDDDVVSSGPEAGTAYIVMELLEGRSMHERAEHDPPIGEIEFLRIADCVLDVLQAAHARGVVHRDLKPENLFLVGDVGGSERPRVKVLDFGLARLLQGQTITTYGLALGTPSFMSPEQAAGRLEEIDGGTDLFALAATGFRLITGRRIHEGSNAVELVTKMASLPAPRIQTIAPGVSDSFARIIDRALQFRRSDRYASATEMQADVQRAISEIDAGLGATQPAVATGSSGAVPSPRGPPTIEISRRDLEISEQRPVEAVPASRRPRRSIVPWVAVALFAAMSVKIGLDRVRAASTSPPSPASDRVGMTPSQSSGPPRILEADAALGPERGGPMTFDRYDASVGGPVRSPIGSARDGSPPAAPENAARRAAPAKSGLATAPKATHAHRSAPVGATHLQ
jgi:eukaryotic-like serine/threonine-protein kinase